MSGQRKYVKCGRVYLTAIVEPWIEGNEPTALEVAARLGTVISVTLLFGAVLGVGLAGGLSGATSVRGVKMDGVLADGRIMVIRGRTIAETGVYELYIHAIELP